MVSHIKQSSLLLLGVVVLLVTRNGQAQEESPIAVCVEKHESAQVLRMEGQLLEAEEQLKRCAADVCPDVLRNDCLRWRAELAEEVPSIVVDVRTDDGNIDGATVTVDGVQVADQIDGRPIRLNPGTKEVVVALDSGEKQTKKFVLAQGERNRQVVADFRTEKPEQTRTVTRIVRESRGTPTRPIPTLTYIFGGTAVAAAGVGTGFGIDALSKKGRLDEIGCQPLCKAKDANDALVESMRTSAVVSDVSFGVAVASGITAMIFYFTRPVVYVKDPSAQTEEVVEGEREDGEDAVDAAEEAAPQDQQGGSAPVSRAPRRPRISVGATGRGAMILVQGKF